MLVMNQTKLRCPTFFFFFNDTATTEIYTLSLHDALPILNGLETLVIIMVANKYAFLQITRRRTYSDRKSGSAGMPRPISYAVFCLKKKNRPTLRRCRSQAARHHDHVFGPLRHRSPQTLER